MRAVISVIGKDTVGILAKVSTKCASMGANIVDVTQTILQDMFAMVMIVDISKMNIPFAEFSEQAAAYGKEAGLVIHVMHEDIFNSMHNI